MELEVNILQSFSGIEQRRSKKYFLAELTLTSDPRSEVDRSDCNLRLV